MAPILHGSASWWRFLRWGSLAVLLGITCSCARRDEAAVEQQGDADAQRRVYLGLARPLISGDQLLLDAMPQAEMRTAAFVLGSSGAVPLDRPAGAEDACREEIALFVSARHPDGVAELWLLDPRTLRLVRIEGADCSLYRGILVDKALGLRDGALEVFRFDFATTAGLPAATRCARLTSDGGNALPVALPARHRIVYQHRIDDSRTRLMRMDEDGGATRPLLADQPFAARHLRADGEGVVFAADPDGVYRLYHCDVDTGAITPWAGDAPAGPQEARAADTTVAFTLDDGQLRPRVVEVPRQLSLQAVAALVEARNPAVLRRRALLAAALIEAHQLRLANLPTLSLGAFYTPVVGVFTNPVQYSGDYLAESVVRGVLGVVQPLFEWDRNHALSEAGSVRAAIARDALAEELNRQQADAALSFVACQAVRERLAGDRELLALAERSAALLARLRRSGRSGEEQELVGEQERIARLADVASDECWLRVLLDRLRGQCGLASASLAAPGESASWDEVPVDDYPALLRVALLNHPALSAAHAAVREAFFAGQAGSRYRPSLIAAASYSYSSRYGDPVDDFVSLGLSGNLPLAWFKDRDLDHGYQQRIHDALRAAEEEAALTIRRDLADSWAAYHQAHGALGSERAHLRAAQEALREARMRAERGQPGSDVPLNASGLFAFEREAVLARRTVGERWREVAERYIRIVESQGLAAEMWKRLPAARPPHAAKAAAEPGEAAAAPPARSLPASTWAWQREALLADGGVAALATARRAGIDRIYLYVGGEGATLEAQASAPVEDFIARCEGAGVAVWALLGEPQWLTGSDGLDRACARIAAFQERAAHRFQGLKLDLEPQALPAWAAGGARQEELVKRYLALLAGARAAGTLPLWVDCPPQFFRDDRRELLAQVAAAVDGATALCYSVDGDRVVALAQEAMAAWPKALELGIELGTGSPPAETLAGWSPERIAGLRRRLEAAGAGMPRLRGLAIHDLAALAATAAPATPSAPPPPSSEDQP